MSGKFALIRYAKNQEEIPVKTVAFLKNSKRFSSWYIGKFLPYSITETEKCGVSGYEIILPVKDGHDVALINKISRKISADCAFLGVTAVIPCGNFAAFAEFFIPSGNFIKFFLLKDIIHRCVRKSQKDLKSIETVVIEGELHETGALISSIYDEFNYLSIILENNSRKDYEPVADFIFDDCGLNLSLGERGSHLLKEADIVINLSRNKKGYGSHLKKGACYIELSPERQKAEAMSAQRNDITVIDSFNIETADGKMPAKLYEALLYCKCREFFRHVQSGGEYGEKDAVLNQLKADKAVVRNLNI